MIGTGGHYVKQNMLVKAKRKTSYSLYMKAKIVYVKEEECRRVITRVW